MTENNSKKLKDNLTRMLSILANDFDEVGSTEYIKEMLRVRSSLRQAISSLDPDMQEHDGIVDISKLYFLYRELFGEF